MVEAEPKTDAPASARWLHRWAIVTALATLPLLFLGAGVTSMQWGMADPVWPTSPLYLLVEGTSWERGIAFVFEHAHRLAGYIVGTCVIVLVLGLWRWEPRRWVRWLGVAALVGVTVQGLLGGFRVRLHALLGSDLALIHGCFGQLVFATLVTLALATSRRWREAANTGLTIEAAALLRRWSLIVTGLLVAQLLFGAFIRHMGSSVAQRVHLLTAFAIVAAIAWLARVVWENPMADRNVTRAVRFLAILVGVQLLLGVEAWMIRLANPQVIEPGHWLWNRELVRTGHVVVGALLLATSVVLTLEAHRLSTPLQIHSPEAPTDRLEEAA
jgi:cytochrome c oxidase assembly protein subunit 15